MESTVMMVSGDNPLARIRGLAVFAECLAGG